MFKFLRRLLPKQRGLLIGKTTEPRDARVEVPCEDFGQPGYDPSLCTGCGSTKAEVNRRVADLCQDCYATLRAELNQRRDVIEKYGPYHRDNKGPRFLATFYGQMSTFGVGLYVSKTAAEAMAEATRIAMRNGWRLLRLDIQETLTDIYCAQDFGRYFPGATRKPLAFDQEKYGPIPALFK